MEQYPLYIKDPDALVTAACCGDYELVKHLIQEGADPNVKDETGKTAVIAAADEGGFPFFPLYFFIKGIIIREMIWNL